MKLIVDTGNTYTKVAFYDALTLVAVERIANEKINIAWFEMLFNRYGKPQRTISAATGKVDAGLLNWLGERTDMVLFSTMMPLPVTSRYKTMETLGHDRLAAVVAAHDAMRDVPVLVVDAGTAITYDYIDENGEYYGGAISPGISMRLKALHTFTEKLPLVEIVGECEFIGDSTEKAIASGVLNGVCAEVEGVVEKYYRLNQNLHVILCGGDAHYFDKCIKNNIFALPNLVLNGLNLILDYHFEITKKQH